MMNICSAWIYIFMYRYIKCRQDVEFLYLGDIFVCLKELQDMLSCQFLQETGYFLHVEKIRENK